MDMINEGAHIARSEAARSMLAPAGEYLTYRLGGEEFALDIQRVQEIRSYEEPTRVPGAPGFVKGVVNLRGVIVPIVDLRLRLGSPAEYNRFTVVIVLAVNRRVIGVVVDSVSDVIDLTTEQIKPPPEVSASGETDFITGIGSTGQRMLMLVDLEVLLDGAIGPLGQLS